jgi:cytochrome P450
MPFGAGARMCVGNHFALVEMMIIIAKLFKAFDFQLMENPKVELQALITLRPKNGVWLSADKRRGT